MLKNISFVENFKNSFKIHKKIYTRLKLYCTSFLIAQRGRKSSNKII